MLEKLRNRRKKKNEEDWFPERDLEQKKIIKKKTKKVNFPKKRKKPTKAKVKFEPVYYEEDMETKKRIPYVGTINRIIAAFMFFIQIINGVLSLTYNGGLFLTMIFFLTAYILAAYLWNSRRKKQKWT